MVSGKVGPIMEAATIHLSTRVLDWAAAQRGSTLFDFAPKVSKRASERILQGILTNAQVVKFAKLTGVPLGYLFLDEPPAPRELPVADFRTVQYASPLSSDFFEIFDDVKFKQSWYREFLEMAGGDRLPFVGRFSQVRPDVVTLATDIKETLRFEGTETPDLRNSDELFSLLSSRCEDVGILVFKNGIVGNNTHRPLDVAEFRGFALADAFAPVVFINGADAPAAWVFTLVHELAHIWLGFSGVSDLDTRSENEIERYCNAVAAEFLVPKSVFRSFWNDTDGVHNIDRISLARAQFKVSKLVIARRALDLRLIDRDFYNEIYDSEKQKSGSGGNFYSTLAVRNSKKFTNEVTHLAVSGSITLGQAGRLLNTTPNNVMNYYVRNN